MSAVRLRRAAVNDLAALVAFENLVFPDDPFRIERRQWRSLLGRATAEVVVAAASGDLVGVVVLAPRPEARSLRIYSLGVHPHVRRQGIASRLVDWTLAWARAEGYEAVHLETRADNHRAIRLYQRAGFSVVGRLPNYYGAAEDGLRLARRLEEPS